MHIAFRLLLHQTNGFCLIRQGKCQISPFGYCHFSFGKPAIFCGFGFTVFAFQREFCIFSNEFTIIKPTCDFISCEGYCKTTFFSRISNNQ
ncbi:Uncharacterised protein [Mycobacteroides abscessus subsp. massiliense]|nr:Uncharacterised protein [Mycobacteroides abscessus subsp. massiliense]